VDAYEFIGGIGGGWDDDMGSNVKSTVFELSWFGAPKVFSQRMSKMIMLVLFSYSKFTDGIWRSSNCPNVSVIIGRTPSTKINTLSLFVNEYLDRRMARN
jgi:hypothetical protein